MAKYGRRLRFGYSPTLTAANPKHLLRQAELAETLGLEYVGIQDFPHNAAHHDAWTLLTAIAMETSRISLFTTVGDLSLRSPARLARAAASLELLTNGRLTMGLDTGASGSEQGAIEEAIQLMRLLWSGERSVQFEGKFFQSADLHPGPIPGNSIRIWLSGNDPHTLALAGQLADGWIATLDSSMQLDALAGLSQQLDDAAASAGRNPSEIQRILSITGTICEKKGTNPFQGPEQQWAEAITDLAMNVGIDTFVLMEGENAEDQLRIFVREIVPRATEMVVLDVGPLASGLARARLGSGASGATPAEEATGEVDCVDEASMESFPASDPPGSASIS